MVRACPLPVAPRASLGSSPYSARDRPWRVLRARATPDGGIVRYLLIGMMIAAPYLAAPS